jgi:ABC-type oligopeptide transport system substrate-binding subunit
VRVHGWCADYPDPGNWLPQLLATNAPFNRTHYSNPALDALLDEAAHTVTDSLRIELYQQAEQLAVSEAAELPLYHDALTLLFKPWVSGGVVTDWQWSLPFDDVAMAVRSAYLPLVLKGW